MRSDAPVISRLFLVLLVLFGVSAPTTLTAQEPATGAAGPAPLWGGALVEKVDSLAAHALDEGPVASLAVAVRKGDHLLLARGYGMADVENSVPADAGTVYRIGSITKQFTAAAIMRLVEEGRLDLEDPMSEHLPDFDTQGHTVTIRHLLDHTSGIRSYTSLEEWGPKRPLPLTDEELVDLFEDEPFDFAPGEEWSYNNSAYYLLGMVVEAVTGTPYADWVEAELFAPLGLSRSYYCDTRRIIPDRAAGYAASDGGLVNADFLAMSQPGAAGALCSTVLDLLAWSTALRSGDVVSAASYERMTTPATLPDGSSTGYGFGLGLGELEGHPHVSHGGGINGFSTMLAHYPEADLDVVVLANTSTPWAGRVAETVARWALGLEVVSVLDLALSDEERAVYEGSYQLMPDLELTVFSRDGQLWTRATGQGDIRLRAQGDHVFVPTFDDQVRLVFVVEDGTATAVVLHQGGQQIEGPRIDPGG